MEQLRLIPEKESGEFQPLPENFTPLSHFELFNSFSPDCLIQKRAGNKTPIHWGMNIYNENKRHIGQKVLQFDLDLIKEPAPGDDGFIPRVGYDENAVKTLIDYLGVDASICGTVWTGYGIHFYLFFKDAFFPVQQGFLKGLVRELKRLNFGAFKIDPLSCAPNRYMRLPGGYYRKEGRLFGFTEKKLKPRNEGSFQEFKERFKKLEPEIKKPPTIEQSLKTAYKWMNQDINAILGTGPSEGGLSGCRFLRWCIDNQKEPNYMEWKLSLSLLSKMKKNEKESVLFCWNFSKGYPGFDMKVFKKAYTEARKNMYPASCKSVGENWRYASHDGIGCVTCPHKPLNLPLRIKSYPNKDEGFRVQKVIKSGKGTKVIPGAINYESFSKYLNEQKGIISEKDGSLYRKLSGYYQPYSAEQMVSDYQHIISPGITPSEISNIKTFFAHWKIFDYEEVQDKFKNYIVFNNLVFDLKTENLHNIEEKFINFYKMDFDYDMSAMCPAFNEVLDFAFSGNETAKEYFLKYMGMSVFSNEPVNNAMLLVGEGRNGKSTLMNGIKNMFPKESYMFFGMDLKFLEKDQSFLEYFRKCRIYYCSDSNPREMNVNLNQLKRLIHREDFVYRNPYSRVKVMFQPKANIILGLNQLPSFQEGNTAIQRRFSVLNFLNIYPKETKIHLEIEKEKAGIFNLLYESFKIAQKEGLPLLEEPIKEAFDGDLKYAWMKECLVISEDENQTIWGSDIWENFKAYAEEQGELKFLKVSKRKLLRWIYSRSEFRDRKVRSNAERGLKGVAFTKNFVENNRSWRS